MTLTAEVHRACYLHREYKKVVDDLVRLRVRADALKYQHKHSLRHIARADRYRQLRRTIESNLILQNSLAGGLSVMEILEGKRFV
jgi:hypothetical protein